MEDNEGLEFLFHSSTELPTWTCALGQLCLSNSPPDVLLPFVGYMSASPDQLIITSSNLKSKKKVWRFSQDYLFRRKKTFRSSRPLVSRGSQSRSLKLGKQSSWTPEELVHWRWIFKPTSFLVSTTRHETQLPTDCYFLLKK